MADVTFVDSHAHLADSAFDADRDGVVRRAREAGALAIVCIGESLAAADKARELATRHPGFVAWTAGVHPHDAASYDAARHPSELRTRIEAGACAVGECGLDYHYDRAPRDKQQEAFAGQLALARDTGRPLVVHTRDAAKEMQAVLAEAARANVPGVLHCFTGPSELGRAALDAGWSLSFSGIITFRSWPGDDLARLPPDDRLLVESDAPYLAPVPHRGKRNEPAWVRLTVDRLAAARGSDASVLGAQLSTNAARFFGLAIDAE